MGRAPLANSAREAGRVRAILDGIDAKIAAAIDGLDDRGADSANVMRSSQRCTQSHARRVANRAKSLEKLPSVRKALEQGRITGDHVDSLAKAAEHTSPDAVEEAGLVERFAEGRPADIAGKDIRRWAGRRQRADHKQTVYDLQRKNRKASVFTNKDTGMTTMIAEFDPVTGAEIQSCVDKELKRLHAADGGRDNADSVRTFEQRRADAMANLMLGRAGTKSKGSGSGRPEIVIVADADVISGKNPDGRCEIAGNGPIPKSVLERLACDAVLYGVVFSGDGDPLWHGHGVRTATPAQKRALIAECGGCAVCAAHPDFCEAHHIIPWAPPARGPTDIDNLILLCVHHHHQLHELGLVLVESADGRWQMDPTENSFPVFA